MADEAEFRVWFCVESAVPQLGLSVMQKSRPSENMVDASSDPRFVRVKLTSSTMDLAARLAKEGAPHGLVVVADEQMAGRGRHGREWVSAPGRDLLASILFRPRAAILPEIQFVAVLAAVEVVRATTGRSPSIKWPNDIRVDGKKVCGILLESHENSLGWAAIAGFGINLHTSTANRPDLPPAASLSEVAGRSIDRDNALKLLVKSADCYYERVSRGDSLLEEWSTLVDTVGQHVSVAIGDPRRPERVVNGVAEGIGEFGRLLVRDDDGRVWPLVAGDVSLSAHGPVGENG